MGSIAILFTLLIATSAVLPGQGIITTMAGVQFASCGPLGDGGPATSAQLCGAQSPAADASGNIYFFDYGNARIRKIAPDGTITTIAGTGVHGSSGDGGPALNATLGGIFQMAVDPSGQHLCFGDVQAYKIRCITSGQTVTFTATVTSVGATGVVQFLDGATQIGSAALSNGTAVFSTKSLAVGNHSIKASYGGDSNVNGSQSAALSYKVKH